MIREKDMVYENGKAWVWRAKDCYYVMISGITHSTSDSAYSLDDNGLGIAKARCDYLAKRRTA